MALNRRLMIGLAVGALVAGVGVGALLHDGGDDADDFDTVLDTPGTYQVPGIGTNAPVAGDVLADVTLTDLDGKPFSTADLKGKPTVINVWFSTCQPCKREMPTLAAMDAALGGAVRFVGIDPNDTAETARSFAAEFGVTYPTYLDPDGAFTSEFGINTFPSTLFVNADGVIVRQKAGELTADDLRTIIETELLG